MSNDDIDTNLIVCNSLVKMNNGSIRVQSEGVNEGKIVTISIHMPR